ncbi:6-hydroxy-D-nicotine oxidase [Escovopsis weberi]|uniref:6-hydroxy-D-nicotine oxidase n=1 Tax=Escovopsis weberi TaxID=150374 RepID=A0A0N0RT46_ESCWE|nr:6-hydroxy-D-nicotine oxidase [Escovopsis weberi]
MKPPAFVGLIESSSSVQAAIFANASCGPFSDRGSPCLLGNYARYAVNVSSAEDVAAAVRFANEKNIRLVIRNTAHDYMGRSTGAGALAIWTHHLKGAEVVDWSDAEYVGKAIRIGAGMQGWEVGEAARAAGLVVVTGACPTVGIAGGYTQSGGHSPLSTAFGLSADNTLAFEVVLADGGRVVVADAASPEFADLFWALSGSGAGNFGVVVSVTLRAHPDAVTGGASFTVAAPGALEAWHAALPGIIAEGAQATYTASGGDKLWVPTVTGYGLTGADMERILAPFAEAMRAIGVALPVAYTEFASYHDHYWHYLGPPPAGTFGNAESQLMGGRLIPAHLLPRAGPAIKETIRLGSTLIGVALNVSRFASPSRRAVLPQWRDALIMSAYELTFSPGAPISQLHAQQDLMTNTIMPVVEAVLPDTGAYINEADFQQRDWQSVFYGANYGRLLRVKRKYDPRGLLYNSIAVGSERWEVRKDGRMCATQHGV